MDARAPAEAEAVPAAPARGGAAAEAGPGGGRVRAPSRLTRRIVGFNLIGLGLLVAGVLVLNDFRDQLVELRTEALETQGEIIAITLAESAGTEAPAGLDVEKARVVIDRLVQPADVRAQIFDRGGRLMTDSRLLAGRRDGVEVGTLPADRFERLAPEPEGGWPAALRRWLRDLTLDGWSRDPDLGVVGGVAREREVYAALGGETARGQRINARGELIVSVSVPVMRLGKVLGALVLSTRGGDIDAVVQGERISILQVFLVALAVSVVLSILLANAISRPIERRAEAALRAERGGVRSGAGQGRVDLPDLSYRGDEIGHLSGALGRMTAALYSRIEATESFAADVAHEIKNPLSSLRSAVETLPHVRRDEDRERLLAIIREDVARLDRLVTDISNASRLDAELVREERESFDLAALLESLAEHNRFKAERRGAELTLTLPQRPLTMLGIEARLAQVFVNLIENAVSFTPEGGRIRLEAVRLGDGRLRVTVEDDGPGIPDAALASVFERFYSERPDSEAFGAHSGLGLSISRQIVEAHGGEIRAENVGAPGDPRRGARFVVDLPG
jgi:two-component system sensor histidine kinase ChvG